MLVVPIATITIVTDSFEGRFDILTAGVQNV